MNTDTLFTLGVAEILPKVDILKSKLEKNKHLTVKFGADPTAADLHLGHAVVLWKMRELQDAGHHVTFIVGDYTSMIGDPSGKDKTRPALTTEEIELNCKTYFDQAGKILDLDKLTIVKNSEWLSKISFAQLISYGKVFTVQQMLARDTFRKRIDAESPLHIHEILYPIVQAIDSVELKADLELGGTDQTFNMLAGRQLQEALDMPAQCVMTFPLLVGLDGAKKMSKSLNNYVGLMDSANEMFGKLMSISDELISDYAELCARMNKDDVAALQARIEGGENPRDIKIEVAKAIIDLYHEKGSAEAAHENFTQVFAQGQLPDEMPEFVLDSGDYGILELLSKGELCTSSSEARRMIEQGAVKVNQEKVDGIDDTFKVSDELVLQVGKRKFCRFKSS